MTLLEVLEAMDLGHTLRLVRANAPYVGCEGKVRCRCKGYDLFELDHERVAGRSWTPDQLELAEQAIDEWEGELELE